MINLPPWTWLQFKEAVKVFITVDASRLNIQDLVETLTRQAVIDLQSYIAAMRFPHETQYTPADLGTDGLASVGTLPDEAIPRDMYYVKENDVEGGIDNTCARSPVDQYPWGSRYDIVCGNVPVNGCRYKVAMSPQAGTFYVFPKVADGHRLSLFWEGQRIFFDDDTLVPFAERSAMAAAMFVKAGIVREVDRDPALALSYMGVNPIQPGTYLSLRSACYLDAGDRRRMVDSATSPRQNANCANVTTCVQTPMGV